MAYIQDSTQSFTITLTALLEGIGIINYMAVRNLTKAIDYEWEVGSWVTPLPEAVEADSISVYIGVANTGAVTDTLFGEFSSVQVTPAEALIQEMLGVATGFVGEAEWTFTMPAQNVNITINAGHVE